LHPLLVEELTAAPDPAEACARLAELPHRLLLESAPGAPGGRHSFLCADPRTLLRSRAGRVERVTAAGAETLPGVDAFEALRLELAAGARPRASSLPPFTGGAAGYLGYELTRYLERVPVPEPDPAGLPEMVVGFYDWVIAWDHRAGRCWLIADGSSAEPGGGGVPRARRRAGAVRERLAAPAPSPESAPATPALRPASAAGGVAVPELAGAFSSMGRERFEAVVARTREYILAGDIFQANLSHRLTAPVAEDAFDLYRRLRRDHPAAFAAYFDLGDAAVVSASPERFLRVDGERVTTSPIKGTAPRGATRAEDAALAAALEASGKDRAENAMIVDLLRNDLSIVCRDGSVAVPALCALETHPTVHHLVSTVAGRLRPGQGPVELLRAAFPGGSITGAPKIRAMEIIAELEGARRGVYTGAIGYVGYDGAMDTSIAIRTAVVRDGVAHVQVGCGIVADSEPAAEWRESLAKGRGLLAAVEAGWSC
jgi:para-aminobenzoate synthetase component I